MINIAAIVIFGLLGRHDDGFTYAQAYWSTVSSTTISTLTNVTLVIDYIKTDRFANSGSGLTHKQRSLVIIVMMLLIWIAIGAGVFAMLLGVPFQQGLYFTIVSIESQFSVLSDALDF
jgi:potassium channel subfamily K, other eukaryote